MDGQQMYDWSFGSLVRHLPRATLQPRATVIPLRILSGTLMDLLKTFFTLLRGCFTSAIEEFLVGCVYGSSYMLGRG